MYLVAVVVAFFICWAPFHAQRLLAVYLSNASPEAQETFAGFYVVLMHTSGVLYFVSTTVNPVLYHIMSKKFREAFKVNIYLCLLVTKTAAKKNQFVRINPIAIWKRIKKITLYVSYKMTSYTCKKSKSYYFPMFFKPRKEIVKRICHIL